MSYGVHPYAVDYRRLPDPGDMDGYALERALGGRFLSNRRWSAMRMSWFDAVDAALAAAGFEGTLSRWFMRGSPVAIPPPDDFPMIGRIEPSEVEGLLSSLRKAVLGIDESDAYDAVAEVIGWLDGLREGEGIVTFYY